MKATKMLHLRNGASMPRPAIIFLGK